MMRKLILAIGMIGTMILMAGCDASSIVGASADLAMAIVAAST